ncbi:MAG TPA: metallophosphoesterase [Candidatus Deferrimicrobium sp.]|nr:metallophosphoesterase [Candidatus Deferrimicrobium sp.]
MRVLLLSDTHLTDPKKMPTRLLAEISTSDCVLHAGDFTSFKVVELLETESSFIGVAGNNDSSELQEKLGYKQRFELAGYRIGMVHGDLGVGKTTLDRALNSFADCELDLLIFGHSHQPYLKKHGDTWVVNPGSPTNRRNSPSYSYGLMELGTELQVQLVYY